MNTIVLGLDSINSLTQLDWKEFTAFFLHVGEPSNHLLTPQSLGRCHNDQDDAANRENSRCTCLASDETGLFPTQGSQPLTEHRRHNLPIPTSLTLYVLSIFN